MIKTLDPPKFFANAGDKISYNDWHLQMLSKMSINKLIMLTKSSKQSYILSRVADKTFAQLKFCLHADATKFFGKIDEMFEVLTAAFGNANKKQKSKAKY